MTRTHDRGQSPRELAFFAAANTEGGFVNRFPALFGETSGIGRLYVIKGGPGTGKSRFLRTAAEYASARGQRVIYLYCSSDPDSLDGLIVSGRDGAVGLLDGTPPHGWEPSRPGVREELVDLGAFWDTARLSAQGDAVERLCREKAAAYAQAYRRLRACGEADRVSEDIVLPLCDRDRLRRRAERLLRTALRQSRAVWAGHAGGADTEAPGEWLSRLSPGGRMLPPLFRKGFGMTGLARLGTLEGGAERVICLPDRTGMGALFMSCLEAASEKAGVPCYITNAPLRPDRIDGIWWPTLGLCVLCGESDRDSFAGVPLDLRRYADAEGLRRVRREVHAAAALRDALSDAALGALARARDAHFALEALYGAAMDFPAKEAFTRAFCRRVFGD